MTSKKRGHKFFPCVVVGCTRRKMCFRAALYDYVESNLSKDAMRVLLKNRKAASMIIHPEKTGESCRQLLTLAPRCMVKWTLHEAAEKYYQGEIEFDGYSNRLTGGSGYDITFVEKG